MISGKIIKGIGGFYYVRTAGGKIIECKARGKFRKDLLKPFCGDNVMIEVSGDKGTVNEILPRANSFVRPPVANIDTMIIVVSCANPKPDFAFADKMLVICAANSVDAILCMTKTDLCSQSEIEKFAAVYQKSGYEVLKVSNKTGEGDIDMIKQRLAGKTTAFAGFSGVGKSSLLNSVMGDSIMQTGAVSERLGRGRHTTRHVQLVEYAQGFVVDTPGFGSLELPDMEPSALKECFREFGAYEINCRFADCMHLGTKWCGVYDAVCSGDICESRYKNYKDFYAILKEKKEW